MTQQLHQQPGRVTAGAARQAEGFFGCLYTWLHTDQILNILLHQVVQTDQEVDGGLVCTVDFLQIRRNQRGGVGQRIGLQVGCEFLRGGRVVSERKTLGRRLQKEVKRVVDRHFDHQVDGDLEFFDLFREHQARLVVGKRVLLPVDEVASGFDFERIRHHCAAAMRRRSQAHNLWPEGDRAVVGVMGDVVEGGLNRHINMLASSRP